MFASSGTILLVYSFGKNPNCLRRPQHVGPKDYYTCGMCVYMWYTLMAEIFARLFINKASRKFQPLGYNICIYIFYVTYKIQQR